VRKFGAHLVELAESTDQADVSLGDVAVRVGDGAARDCSHYPAESSQTVHDRTVQTVLDVVRSEILGVRGLHLRFLKRWREEGKMSDRREAGSKRCVRMQTLRGWTVM
jgi:hypothetical protein